VQILYLIASSHKKPWESLILAQKKTWVKNLPNNHKALFLFGNGFLGSGSDDYVTLHEVDRPQHELGIKVSQISKTENESDLFFDSLAGWEQLLSNTLSGMAHILENYNFDYVVRTNNSTFFNPKKLEQVLASLPDSRIYAGPEYSHQGVKYVGGYSIILSKDVVQKLVLGISRIQSRIIDDVSIGIALEELGVEITILPDIPWLRLRDLFRFSQKMSVVYADTFAFRCKAELNFPTRFIARRLRINPVKIRLDRVILYSLNKAINN
jgi:hypothetical protein